MKSWISNLAVRCTPEWWAFKKRFEHILKSDHGVNSDEVAYNIAAGIKSFGGSLVWPLMSNEIIGATIGNVVHQPEHKHLFEFDQWVSGTTHKDQVEVAYEALRVSTMKDRTPFLLKEIDSLAIADALLKHIHTDRVRYTSVCQDLVRYTSHCQGNEDLESMQKKETLFLLKGWLSNPIILESVAKHTDHSAHRYIQQELITNSEARIELAFNYLKRRVSEINSDYGYTMQYEKFNSLFSPSEFCTALIQYMEYNKLMMENARRGLNIEHKFENNSKNIGVPSVVPHLTGMRFCLHADHVEPKRLEELDAQLAWYGIPNRTWCFTQDNTTTEKRGNYYWTDLTQYSEENQWLAIVSYQKTYGHVPDKYLKTCSERLQAWISLSLHQDYAQEIKNLNAGALKDIRLRTQSLLYSTQASSLANIGPVLDWTMQGS